MTNRTTTTVGELAAQTPNASRVLEKHGIDYCCGGRQSIADACASAGVQMERLFTEIDEGTRPSPTADFHRFNQKELIDHIITTHHVFTRDELVRLDALLQKVVSVHGDRHRELIAVRNRFQRLRNDLIPHMMKEELVLFPYVAEIERSIEDEIPVDPPPFMTVNNPVRMMTMEHEAAGALLRQLRRLTSDYTAPADACVSYRTLYEALANLEEDLHQHIHLENNILFPRAVLQEAEWGTGLS